MYRYMGKVKGHNIFLCEDDDIFYAIEDIKDKKIPLCDNNDIYIMKDTGNIFNIKQYLGAVPLGNTVTDWYPVVFFENEMKNNN